MTADDQESHKPEQDSAAGGSEAPAEVPGRGAPSNEPRGNPEVDEGELERGIDKLEQAGGGH